MYTFLVRLALQLHNLSYKLASKLAIKAEGGLHPKHRLMNYHQFFLDHISSDDVVLDIGCGNGALAFDLAKKARRVVGIDLNPKHQASWRGRFAAPNLSYQIADATTLPEQEPFDVVVLSNVLEHIEHRDVFLRSIKHLAPLFLIRVPMIDRDWITLYKKELGVEYRLDTTHFTEYTFSSFMAELQEAGFTVASSSIQFGEIWAVVRADSSNV
ncbi:methyltransferase domain-containing protein [Candidatus Uhrbacteria bacterium]|nr:methyltransferase domain-containing protein [Candidatus Uhrbacteria bacterium]